MTAKALTNNYDFYNNKENNKELNGLEKIIVYPDPLKINFCSDNDNLFSKKWNFEHNFMLDEFRNIEDKKKKEKKIGKYQS